MSKLTQRFTQRDLARAFRAAKQAGIDVQISILRDGTLNLVPVSGAQELRPSEMDQIIAKLK